MLLSGWMQTYCEQQKAATDSIPVQQVARVVEMFAKVLREDRQVFVFGNGGSAANSSHFITDLGKFLGQLPKGWPYVVEMRNLGWLKPEYFECLAKHQVAHIYNSWEAMPAVCEQMALPGSRTSAATSLSIV